MRRRIIGDISGNGSSEDGRFWSGVLPNIREDGEAGLHINLRLGRRILAWSYRRWQNDIQFGTHLVGRQRPTCSRINSRVARFLRNLQDRLRLQAGEKALSNSSRIWRGWPPRSSFGTLAQPGALGQIPRVAKVGDELTNGNALGLAFVDKRVVQSTRRCACCWVRVPTAVRSRKCSQHRRLDFFSGLAAANAVKLARNFGMLRQGNCRASCRVS